MFQHLQSPPQTTQQATTYAHPTCNCSLDRQRSQSVEIEIEIEIEVEQPQQKMLLQKQKAFTVTVYACIILILACSRTTIPQANAFITSPTTKPKSSPSTTSIFVTELHIPGYAKTKLAFILPEDAKNAQTAAATLVKEREIWCKKKHLICPTIPRKYPTKMDIYYTKPTAQCLHRRNAN